MTISEIENKKSYQLFAGSFFLFSVLLWFRFFHFYFLYLTEEV